MRESIWILAIYAGIVLFSFFYDLLREKMDRKTWWFYIILIGSFINDLFWTWRWDVFNYYLRFLIVLIFIIFVLISYRKQKTVIYQLFQRFQRYTSSRVLDPLPKPNSQKTDAYPILYILLILYFQLSTLPAYFGFIYQDAPVQLRFPLRQGVYYVAHGGSSTVINYHYAYDTQRFALDFMKLNKWGMRANGLTPKELDDYLIYRETVYSPCTGKVVKVVDHIKEIAPLDINQQTSKYREKSPKGNHVMIQCQGVQLTLAHLMPDRVRVKEHTQVIRGHPIGQVGNSGNTSEPHLHIHAEKNGQGVPILFDGRFLTRNSLFFAD